MRCPLGVEESGELVVGYAARTLDPRARAAFERHIEACAVCAEALAGQQALWQALDQWREVGVSDDFDHALQWKIGRVNEASARRRFWYPVVAAGIVLGVAFWMNPPVRNVPRPTQPPQQIEKLEHALDDMDLLGRLSPI
jgi:hypothetical protein